MNYRLYSIVWVCSLLLSCGQKNSSSVVTLRYCNSFLKDTTISIQEIPMNEASLCYRFMKMGDRVISLEAYNVLGIYRYPDLTLIHKQQSAAFSDLFVVRDTLYARNGNTIDKYLFGKDEFLHCESSFILKKGGSQSIWGLQKIGDNRYVYPDNYDLAGLSEFHILNTEDNECLSKGEYIEDASRFKKLNDFKLAYSHALYVKPDQTLFCLFYFQNRRIRIYNAEGDLVQDVFLDYPPGNNRVIDLKYDKRYMHFQRGFVTNEYIYLFSPDKREDSVVVPEGNIVVLDWAGNLITKYRLNCYVHDFFVDEHTHQLVGSCVNSQRIYGFFKFDLVK